VQVRREPVDLASADGAEDCWDVDVDVVDHDGELDFRGPVVQGRRGDRFVYLAWAMSTLVAGSRCSVESS
jgi:hypothetical protein